MDKIRVATWNIGSVLENYERDKKVFLQTVFRDDPDVLFLQECPSDSQLFAELLSGGRFNNYVYLETSQSHVKQGCTMGIAIFAAGELFSKQNVCLTKPQETIYFNGKQEAWHEKFFLKSSFRFLGKAFALITGHGFPFYRYGLKEEDHAFVYHEIEQFICDTMSPQEICIIGADFNCKNAIEYMSFRDTYIDVYAGTPTRASGRKTDSIIFEKSYLYGGVVNDLIEHFDHNYLAVDIYLSTDKAKQQS